MGKAELYLVTMGCYQLRLISDITSHLLQITASGFHGKNSHLMENELSWLAQVTRQP